VKIRHRYPVTTFGVAPDLQRIHPEFGKINRGDVSSKVLQEVLERYRKIETDRGLLDSYITIDAETGRYVVRVAHHQLSLAPENQPPASGASLEPADIIKRLEQPLNISVRPAPPAVEPLWRTVTTLALLVLGVVLIAVAVMPLLGSKARQQSSDITLVRDAADAQIRQKSVAGLFSTGPKSGDRSMTITPLGDVIFAEVGPRQPLGAGTDSYRIGLRDQKTFLVTVRSGVIEVLDANTLRYYGDTYRRVQ
jgi:hypothetical protein